MSDSQFSAEDVLCYALENPIRSIGYVYEGGEHEPATHRWRSVIERYINVEFAIYLTRGERPLSDTDEEDMLKDGILLYWPGAPLRQRTHLLNIELQRCERYLKRTKQRAGDIERAMLVGVRQFMQMPEETLLCSLPCAAARLGERLLCPDEIDGVLSNVPQVLLQSSIRKSSLVLKDGELYFVGLGRRLFHAQNIKLIDDMVQCGPKVMNDFTDPNTPHGVWRLIHLDADEHLAGVLVELDQWAIRIAVKESKEVGLQSVNLIPCSRAFESDAEKRVHVPAHVMRRHAPFEGVNESGESASRTS